MDCEHRGAVRPARPNLVGEMQRCFRRDVSLIDPEPDSTGTGTVDMDRVGLGAIDPIDGESTLLAGDAGDLAELSEEGDFVDLDDSFFVADSFSDSDIDLSI